jgi:hypothetical protein
VVTELFEKLAMQLVGQANSGLVTWMMLALVYLGWNLHQAKKEHRAELKQYYDLVDKLQQSIAVKNGEDRDMLLSVIDKYHQSQIGIREAISEIKSVLTTISTMNRK